MQAIIIFSVLLSLTIVLISVIVLKSGMQKTVNRIFFAMALAISLWVFLYTISTSSEYSNIYIARLIHVFGLCSVVSLFCFSVIYPRTYSTVPSKIIMIVNGLLVLATTPIILFSNVLVADIKNVDGLSTLVMGSMVGVFFLIDALYLTISAGIIIYKYIKSRKTNFVEHRKLGFMVGGLSVTACIITLSSLLVLFVNNLSWVVDAFTPFSSVILIVFISYGILSGGLFDVRSAIVRSVTYTALIITLAGIYAGLTFAASSLFSFDQASFGQTAFNIAISLGLVFMFQPLRRFFDKVTNKIFYKDNYNTDDFFAKLNKVLGFTTDLRGLLERTATEIAGTLKGEQAFFFINTNEGHFTTAGTPKHRQLPKSDADQFSDMPLGKNGVIIASLMDDNNPIKRMMISHRIELALPLIQDNKTIGYLFLGDHLTSNYTNRDIKVLNTISNELIIAIQNALAVQEIREFNITLQQRIANATRELRASNAQLRHLDKAKDEFLSMASHQLRTPLTSVKGYISMIMDGDVGRVSMDQKKLLGEAFNNSERMVGLINDFLSVSRIQTGRFVIDKVPIDLSLVVEQEVDSLRANANTRQMELVYDKPDDCPIMDIDEGKIRQVIMNFIDNAIYYSHPNTKININLSVAKGEILFTVKDTGIGVPKSERDQLFTKFYRASNAKKARPDGTGVGLFLAKKVVDGHDGDVVFDSVEDKGSTFGFSLPIKPLAAASDANDLKN